MADNKDFGKKIKSDPVDKKAKDKKSQQEHDDSKGLDIRKLTLADFKNVAPSAARVPHPFEGYPEKKSNVMIIPDPNDKFRDKPYIQEVIETHIVGLHPGFDVYQDPSNKGISILDRATKKEKIVNLETHHNIALVNYEQGGKNYNVVFDRKLELSDGMVMRFAFCPDPSIRAQLCFAMDPQSGNIKVNNHYQLLDWGQERKLRDVFRMIYQRQNEADALAKKFDTDQESTAADL